MSDDREARAAGGEARAAGAPDEAELLLPWRATGRLAPAEAARLDGLPATELSRRLAFAEEERAATAALNAALPEPSAAARAALFARIGALEAQGAEAARPRPAPRNGPLERLAAWLAGLQPRALGLAAAAAMLVVAVQAGALLATLTGGGARYEVASSPGSGAGSFALVAFAPQATVERVEALLRDRGATIVDGPRPGGLYRLRIGPEGLSAADRDAALGALRDSGLVRLALPGGS